MLKRLRLKNFRNYAELDLQFGPKLNWIVGPNAVGKTNLLEAIYLLSTGRSFRTQSLKDLIKYGAPAFYIEAEFEREGLSQKAILYFDGEKKILKLAHKEYAHFAPLLGILPSTLFSPNCVSVITGLPAERRRYLNTQMAQSDPFYVHHLMRFNRALKQRNALLKGRNVATLGVWDSELIRSSEVLMQKRKETIEALQRRAQQNLESLSEEPEAITLSYLPSLPMTQELGAFFLKVREKEKKFQTTLFGPHRDDLDIGLNDKAAKYFASEGQKRTLTAALKLAEWEWMSERLDPVIFCLDDFGAQLDLKRSECFAQRLQHLGQVLVTTPRADLAFSSEEGRLIELKAL